MTNQQWHLSDRLLSFGSRPLVMGIVNVTPDSFSDGGRHFTPDAAFCHALELVEQGADLLDIGGESTRPGATPVSAEEELRRVLPVVQQLSKRVSVPLSIDTSKAEVAWACLAAGAHIINDVTALVDPAMIKAVRDAKAGLILMHMQGTPLTMQQNPTYTDVVGEIRQFLQSRLHALDELGIAPSRVAIDPGLGFGKTFDHNLKILVRLSEFQQLGRPVCLGASRKGFIGRLTDRPTEHRQAGSVAVACFAMSRQAVQIIRVHDVEATRDAVAMWTALSKFDAGRETEA
jgi:dihydropteroate synthase